ncbi:hypothetical protein BDV93DRAFT_521035 [Ceratobasidium sp. AG-I]|nr:hypothetical protein BDV93DRAFT_521035 [Ceratobasidium sp. AG-I]
MRLSNFGVLSALVGAAWGWETVQDAARLSRELVKREAIATLATVYPADFRDGALANLPFALMEYYADCHGNGSLSYLFFPISQNARNIASAPGKTASFTVRARESDGLVGSFAPAVGSAETDSDVDVGPGVDQMPLTKAQGGWWRWGKDLLRSRQMARGPAASARVALMGRVKVMYGVTGEGDSDVDREARQMSSCFLARHPDAKWWVPGRKGAPHVAWWARFDPEAVYYVGGFGDEHYIGRIPVDLYRNASSTSMYI